MGVPAAGASGGPERWAGAERALRQELATTTALLARLAEDFGRLVSAAAGANADDEHDPEGSTIGFERAQLSGAIGRTRVRLGELEAALSRLGEGSYGTCTRCGNAIAPERLQARPVGELCLACAAIH